MRYSCRPSSEITMRGNVVDLAVGLVGGPICGQSELRRNSVSCGPNNYMSVGAPFPHPERFPR